MKSRPTSLSVVLLVTICAALSVPQLLCAQSSPSIAISSSAQAAAVLVNADVVQKFTEQTGINVRIDTTSSEAALGLLAAGLSDLAITAQRLDYHYQAMGYMEHPFLKDTLAVITNAQTKVDSLTESQLRSLFTGAIKNWKDVEGEDRPVVVVVPAKETALYRNFARMFLEGRDVNWQIMTANSAIVHDVARRFVGAISVVNQAATQGKPAGAKVLKVDGLSPQDDNYPYFEVFSFVTKGQPQGNLKAFMDFVTNSENMNQLVKFGVKAYQE